jgi:adenylyl- and sulfurtransferase ThiI
LDVVIVFPSSTAKRQTLVRAIKKSGRVQVTSEGRYVICKAGDPSRLASRLTDFPGVDGVATARKVSSRFPDVITAIVQEGNRTIRWGEKFYIKVIQTVKADYVDRDIEFGSTALLVGKLAEINALPAKSDKEADRVVLAVIGKRSVYVCVKGTT